MFTKKLGKAEFRLKSDKDLSWLNEEGEVFFVIDSTGSGCICFGVENKGEKLFYKIAGADTVEAEINPQESVRLLEHAVKVNEDIRHPNLSRLIRSFYKDDLFVAVYEWSEGECLFDHWNFDLYERDKTLVSPRERFRKLPKEQRLACARSVISFVEEVHRCNYRAVDLYDSSFMYDFESHKFTICDIDLFMKAPLTNTMGEWWGTKRLKAPEENILGAEIGEDTNIFTVAAIIHDMFTPLMEENVKLRYEKGMFVPLSKEQFQLGERAYEVIMKATSYDRTKRYQSVKEFAEAFEKAI